MNFADWYTDSMDIYRNVATTTNNLTSHTRTKVYEGIPCRVYQDSGGSPNMQQTGADVMTSLKVACDNSVDVKAGDEVIISRGALIGRGGFTIRAFAGDPHYYFEPYGAVFPQLEHQQFDLRHQERI